MLTTKIDRVRLVFKRVDSEDILRELVRLGCVEVSDPGELLAESGQGGLAALENVSLEGLEANRDSVLLLGTQYTLILTGWIPVRSEPELIEAVSGLDCAWETEPPSPDEHELVPVALKWPKLFGTFRRGAGRPFRPLASGSRP